MTPSATWSFVNRIQEPAVDQQLLRKFLESTGDPVVPFETDRRRRKERRRRGGAKEQKKTVLMEGDEEFSEFLDEMEKSIKKDERPPSKGTDDPPPEKGKDLLETALKSSDLYEDVIDSELEASKASPEREKELSKASKSMPDLSESDEEMVDRGAAGGDPSLPPQDSVMEDIEEDKEEDKKEASATVSPEPDGSFEGESSRGESHERSDSIKSSGSRKRSPKGKRSSSSDEPKRKRDKSPRRRSPSTRRRLSEMEISPSRSDSPSSRGVSQRRKRKLWLLHPKLLRKKSSSPDGSSEEVSKSGSSSEESSEDENQEDEDDEEEAEKAKKASTSKEKSSRGAMAATAKEREEDYDPTKRKPTKPSKPLRKIKVDLLKVKMMYPRKPMEATAVEDLSMTINPNMKAKGLKKANLLIHSGERMTFVPVLDKKGRVIRVDTADVYDPGVPCFGSVQEMMAAMTSKQGDEVSDSESD